MQSSSDNIDTFVLIARGVGLDGENESRDSFEAYLENEMLRKVRVDEINWSQQKFVDLPYKDNEKSKYLDFDVLAKTSQAARLAASLPIQEFSKHSSNNIRHAVYDLTILVFQFFPLIFLCSIIAATFLGWQLFVGVQTTLLGIAVVSLLLALIRDDITTWFGLLRGIAIPPIWILLYCMALLSTPIPLYIVLTGSILYAFSRYDFSRYLAAEFGGYTDSGIPIWSTQNSELLTNVLITVPGFLIAAGLFGPIFFILKRFYSPIFKILADILRNIGDEKYRTSLIGYVQRQISKAHETSCSTIILIGHSLGSVILLDALKSFDGTKTYARVFLVTGGSPYKRFFWRFFSTIYPSANILAKELKNSSMDVSWCNVYRPRDFVGTKLGLETDFEASSQQKHIYPPHSHMEYWNDPAIHAVALKLLAKLEL